MNRKIRREINRIGDTCEICQQSEILVQHHIAGRDIPNCNSQTNLCNICSNCHNKIHHGKIIIEGRYLTGDGYKLLWHRIQEESITGNDIIPHIIK